MIKFVEREDVIDIAIKFCKENNLSVEKLEELEYIGVSGVGLFCGPPDEEPRGLTNDIASQPKAALIVYPDGKVKTTEHTQRFLGK